MFTTRRCSLYSPVWRHELVAKKVTQARKGLGTNSVGLATELSLVSKLLQKVIPKKKIFAHRPLKYLNQTWPVEWTIVSMWRWLTLFRRLHACIASYFSGNVHPDKKKMIEVDLRKETVYFRTVVSCSTTEPGRDSCRALHLVAIYVRNHMNTSTCTSDALNLFFNCTSTRWVQSFKAELVSSTLWTVVVKLIYSPTRFVWLPRWVLQVNTPRVVPSDERQYVRYLRWIGRNGLFVEP